MEPIYIYLNEVLFDDQYFAKKIKCKKFYFVLIKIIFLPA